VANLRNGVAVHIRERAYFVLNQGAQTRSSGRVAEGDTCQVLGVQAAHSHRYDLTRPYLVAFTDHEVQRNLLIGIVIVVLIERARMRPGG
jgi:hypothetical protein